MPTNEIRAERYRDHAAKVRDIAKDVPNLKTRRMLEDMAREWEKMADAVAPPIPPPKPNRHSP
jgi:hypothetical protein